jgi:antitoxin component YwqK of YwqJK toxin-antitoxin module
MASKPLKPLSISQLLFKSQASGSTNDNTPATPLKTKQRKERAWRQRGYKTASKSPRRKSDGSAYMKLFYLAGDLAYEGDVLDMEKHGKGKEYWETGNLKYSGGFIDDQYNDFCGYLYYKNGKLIYKGSFKNGLYNGKGVEYARTGRVLYEGAFVDGKRESAYAKLYYPNGKIEYEGGLVNHRVVLILNSLGKRNQKRSRQRIQQ